MHSSVVLFVVCFALFSAGMESDDEPPIHGFHTDGTPGVSRRGRRTRRGASSSRDRESSAPYPTRRRRRRGSSVDSSDVNDISFEWDDIMTRNTERLRNQSYVNRINSNSTENGGTTSNVRIFMAAASNEDN